MCAKNEMCFSKLALVPFLDASAAIKLKGKSSANTKILQLFCRPVLLVAGCSFSCVRF